MARSLKYYGSATIGEKGQAVLPVEVRKKFKVIPGNKFIVLGVENNNSWGIVFVKADAVVKTLEQMVGPDIEHIIDRDTKMKIIKEGKK